MPRHYGWKPDLPDARDHSFRLTMASPEVPPSWLEKTFPCLTKKKPGTLPETVDLTTGKGAGMWPPVFDQGQLGSCTAQAHVAAWAYRLALEGEDANERVLSRLLLYGEEREWLPEDVGASIRDGIKAMARVGNCPETLWPYDLKRWKERPPMALYVAAEKRKAIAYARLSTLADMRQCLADGHPFVYGFSVYPAFEGLGPHNAVLPMPKPDDELLGGHAVCAVGYDNPRRLFLVRNSWGTTWGARGFFWAPYAYLEDRNLSDDLWTTRTIPVA